MIKTPDFFNKLVDSMAPAIFGHQDIKRAILLMLLGGVHKFTHEGINIRGASMFVLLEIQIVLNLSFSSKHIYLNLVLYIICAEFDNFFSFSFMVTQQP